MSCSTLPLLHDRVPRFVRGQRVRLLSPAAGDVTAPVGAVGVVLGGPTRLQPDRCVAVAAAGGVLFYEPAQASTSLRPLDEGSEVVLALHR
jgi:hypothetical protein